VSAPPADSQQENPAGDSPDRTETFLARYPRKLKIGALAALLVVMIGIPWLFSGKAPEHKTKTVQTSIPVAVIGADTKAAIANPKPAPVPKETSSNAANKDAANNDDAKAATSLAQTAADEDDSSSSNAFMVPAPDPGLTEDAPQGSLPRIGEDGRAPWQIYARPFNGNDKRPRIAIVITGLGLSRVASDAAITRLPPNVTLAFDVQSPVVGAWCARARQAGHETLLMLPMEPFDYPRSDPGPNTLLSNLPNSDNLQRLLWALAQASGYVGVTTLSGTRFTTEPDKLKPILDVLHHRGLMVFDTRIAPHSAIADLAHEANVPVAINTEKLDQNLAPQAIDESLSQLEQTARLSGRAVALAAASPIIIDRLEPWIKRLRRDGIVLAPLSAMTQ